MPLVATPAVGDFLQHGLSFVTLLELLRHSRLHRTCACADATGSSRRAGSDCNYQGRGVWELPPTCLSARMEQSDLPAKNRSRLSYSAHSSGQYAPPDLTWRCSNRTLTARQHTVSAPSSVDIQGGVIHQPFTSLRIRSLTLIWCRWLGYVRYQMEGEYNVHNNAASAGVV